MWLLQTQDTEAQVGEGRQDREEDVSLRSSHGPLSGSTSPRAVCSLHCKRTLYKETLIF